jgi:hypothetical protein
MSAIIDFAKIPGAHPGCRFGELGFDFAWLEGRNRVLLRRFAEVSSTWQNLTDWPAGRLFGLAGEYRWRTSGNGGLHAVIIMDSGTLPEGFKGSRALPLEHTGDSNLILWGEWVDPIIDPDGNPNKGPCFFANEIPRVQTYPIAGEPGFLAAAAKAQKTPRLLVRRYRAETQKEEQFAGEAGPKLVDLPQGEFVRCLGFDLLKD